ncbi:MAG TPA: hypothetical protein VH186_03845 [Chloroflexia bacterium]|nr:hypothetical protein [Chloroflexia bacterium]
MSKRLLVLIGGLALVVALAFGATAATFAQTAGSNNGRGSYGQGGMMNGGAGNNGSGMMNGGASYGQGGGMMSGGSSSNTTAAQPLTVDEAKTAATKYLAGFNNSKLVIDEIMIFDNNAYVAIKDTSTGIGAFELLVNPVTKVAFPEYGPNMMWNVLYGHMSGNGSGYTGSGHMGMMGGGNGMMGGGNGMMSGNGMMGGLSAIPSDNYQPGKMSVTADKALQIAQSYLDKAYPGVKTMQKADEFPGYYTVDVQLNGKISGMLSVNGYTGQVWYHTWHGQFLQMVDYGA